MVTLSAKAEVLDTSRVAASNSPVKVTLRKPVISLLASTATALEATTVPAVVPSTRLSSAVVDIEQQSPFYPTPYATASGLAYSGVAQQVLASGTSSGTSITQSQYRDDGTTTYP